MACNGLQWFAIISQWRSYFSNDFCNDGVAFAICNGFAMAELIVPYFLHWRRQFRNDLTAVALSQVLQEIDNNLRHFAKLSIKRWKLHI